MIRIALLAAVIAVPVAAAPLDDIGAALRATSTMTADFAQTAANGTVATGKFALSRPGRIRFAYDKLPLLVVADGKRLVYIDYEVSQVSEWPIGSTPLAPLLDARFDLARVAHVTRSAANDVDVEARDAKHPEYGKLNLRFVRDTAAPGGWSIAGWTATDAQSNLTEIRLSNLRYNTPVAASLFQFRDPRARKLPGRTF